MGRMLKRAYKYRFYPTPVQVDLLNRTFGCVRLVYNRALAERTRVYAAEHRSTTYVETSGWLTEWKQDPELGFLNEVSCVPLQQTLRHLQAGFAAFFAKRARHPSFKSKRKTRASAEFTRSAFRYRDGQLTLAKLDQPLDIRWSRPLPEGVQPSMVTVSRDRAGRWFVSILVETEVDPPPPVDQQVGLDAGLDCLVTLSTGEKIVNPRHEQRDLARAISDAAWFELRRMLEYKCQWYGRDLRLVDRWFPSSKLCSECGVLRESLPLNIRTWACPCGAVHDRDVNAARNILAAGLVER